MLNEQYADIMTNDPEAKKRILNTMQKYGDDRWWLGDNEDRLAYMQMQEDIMLCESEAVQKAVEGLLGRSVPFVELMMDRKNLIQSVINAYKNKYQNPS